MATTAQKKPSLPITKNWVICDERSFSQTMQCWLAGYKGNLKTKALLIDIGLWKYFKKKEEDFNAILNGSKSPDQRLTNHLAAAVPLSICSPASLKFQAEEAQVKIGNKVEIEPEQIAKSRKAYLQRLLQGKRVSPFSPARNFVLFLQEMIEKKEYQSPIYVLESIDMLLGQFDRKKQNMSLSFEERYLLLPEDCKDIIVRTLHLDAGEREFLDKTCMGIQDEYTSCALRIHRGWRFIRQHAGLNLEEAAKHIGKMDLLKLELGGFLPNPSQRTSDPWQKTMINFKVSGDEQTMLIGAQNKISASADPRMDNPEP